MNLKKNKKKLLIRLLENTSTHDVILTEHVNVVYVSSFIIQRIFSLMCVDIHIILVNKCFKISRNQFNLPFLVN